MDYTVYSRSLYGEKGYAETVTEGGNQDQYIDLMQYLPPCWYEVREMAALQKTFGFEMGAFAALEKDMEKQLHLQTATGGLAQWEEDYGLVTDPEKSNTFRRERLRAKKRGNGTTTKQQIVNVASAFAGGEAQVQEHPEEHRFTVRFIGIKGVPGNMADLTATLEEIKPAHLVFDYAYTYNWWDTIRDRTWSSLNGNTWDQVRVI